ncbi:MAG: helix-turn-helix domain-containing protein [Spirochaetota bacterium]
MHNSLCIKEDREVISMDIWNTIKVLRNRGVSILQISKQLKISRNTVRRYINTQHPPHPM